jgi:hypothetical protein
MPWNDDEGGKIAVLIFLNIYIIYPMQIGLIDVGFRVLSLQEVDRLTGL